MTSSNKFFSFNEANATRSFALLGIGAALGLAIAGASLFTAPGTSTLIVPAEDVASVNQRPISRLDFNALLQTTYDVSPAEATPEQKRSILEAMVREELFVQRGIELDSAAVDPAVRSALVAAVEQQIAADAETRQPTDDALQAYYTANQGKYASEGTVTVLDFIAPTRAQAEAAIRAAADLTPTAGFALSGLQDSGKVKGEEFYFAAKIHLGDALFAAAREMANNTISAPLEQPDGVHVLVMVKNAPPVPTPFARARATVLTDWRRDHTTRLLAKDQDFLRKRANVLIAEDLR